MVAIKNFRLFLHTATVPSILNQPSDIIVNNYRSSYEFKCTVEGIDVQILWNKVGPILPVISTERNTISGTITTSTLRFNNRMTGYYSGEYCIAKNDVGETTSQHVSLHVQGRYSFQDC